MDFLEATIKLQDEEQTALTEAIKDKRVVNYLTGKLLQYCKGQADPQACMKVIKIMVETQTEKAISKIFNRRSGVTLRDFNVSERNYDTGYCVSFYIQNDCDIFQSEDTRSLKELGYEIEMIHPSADFKYSIYLRKLS